MSEQAKIAALQEKIREEQNKAMVLRIFGVVGFILFVAFFGSYFVLNQGIVNRTIASRTANDGSYSWTISSTQTEGTDYKIRITSTSYSSIMDSSNSNFAITA